MKPTWTGLPDIEPTPRKDPVDLEQAENMRAALGPEIWEALERRVMDQEKCKPLWPWKPVSKFNGWNGEEPEFETPELDKLAPDWERQQQAAIRYTDDHRIDAGPVTYRATVTLPALITVAIVIALAISAMAIRG